MKRGAFKKARKIFDNCGCWGIQEIRVNFMGGASWRRFDLEFHQEAVMLQSSQHSLPLWVMYLQALGLPLFALALTLFGIRNAMVQTRVSKEKLRHDLYDRRYAIYWAFENAISVSMGAENPTEIDKAWRQEFESLSQSSFILNSEMRQYLQELNNTIFTMYMEEGRYRGRHDISTEDVRALEVKKTQNLMKLSKMSPVLAEKFEPFLKLDDLSGGVASKAPHGLPVIWRSLLERVRVK
jgi:hypothetical protein